MTKEIKLTQGKVALVDDADYEYLSQWQWCALKAPNTFYAVRNSSMSTGKRSTIYMHQVLCGKGADHVDGNGINNTRGNLRLATHAQNMRNSRIPKNNSSGFKGVTWDKQHKKWRAQIQVNGRTQYLGLFAGPEEAGSAYDAAARELHGDYARLNFEQEGR